MRTATPKGYVMVDERVNKILSDRKKHLNRAYCVRRRLGCTLYNALTLLYERDMIKKGDKTNADC